MITNEHVPSNMRDRTALTYLSVGLDDAVATGRPAPVRWIPTSHTNRELVQLATALCTQKNARVLVLGGDAVTFVPLR